MALYIHKEGWKLFWGWKKNLSENFLCRTLFLGQKLCFESKTFLSQKLFFKSKTFFLSKKKKFKSKTFLVQACLCAPHVVTDEAKLAIVFTFFFLLIFFPFLFFFYAFCFSPTLEKLLWLKFSFPPYFGITRWNLYKKIVN